MHAEIRRIVDFLVDKKFQQVSLQKEIFDLAAQTFAMNSKHTLNVGASYEDDICDIHGHSLWFNHRLRILPKQKNATQINEVTSFRVLFPTIKRLFS